MSEDSKDTGFIVMPPDPESLSVAGETLKHLRAMQTESLRDELTGAYNRRKFNQEIYALERSQKPYSFILADIDHFKDFNDNHGHDAGDEVLKEVVRIFSSNVNVAVPTEEEDVVVRWGGEEIGVILKGVTDLDTATEVAERLRVAVHEAKFKVGDKDAQLSISLGVGIKAKGESPDEFIKRVDKAMYISKNISRNIVTVSEYDK
jgi:diguanylate cyclase (GGDEF)-like protein